MTYEIILVIAILAKAVANIPEILTCLDNPTEATSAQQKSPD